MVNTQLQPGDATLLLVAGRQRADAAPESVTKPSARNSKKKHKHKHRDVEQGSKKQRLKMASPATSDLDRLRSERRQREAAERARQLQMLRQSHRT